MLSGPVDDALLVYLSACSVTVSASELSQAGATLACGGAHPVTNHQALPPEYVRDVISVMATCGMYDAAGQ